MWWILMNILYNLNTGIYPELYDVFVINLLSSKAVVRASFLFFLFSFGFVGEQSGLRALRGELLRSWAGC